MNKMKLLVIAVLCCTVFVNVNAQKKINLNDTSSPAKFSVKTQVIPEKYAKEAKAGRVFTINKALQSAQSVKVGDIVDLQLFEDKNYAATVSNIVTDVNGTLALTLKLPDYPMGFAIITTSTEGKSLVTMSIPELAQSFGSRCSIDSKVNYLLEIDESKREPPRLENDVIPIPKAGNEGLKNAENLAPLKSIQSVNCGGPAYNTNTDLPATISLLVVYTPAAAATPNVAGHGGIDNVIALMIALGNLCFSNSETGITLTLAHSEQVDYTENNNMDISLSWLRYNSYVQALRKQYKAALVQLLTNDSNVSGIANSPTNTGGNYDSGFSVCWVDQVPDIYYLSAHEIGHNMGLGHGAQQTSGGVSGIFSYSKGWRWEGNTQNVLNNYMYTSVMSAQGDHYGDGLISLNVPYFSNPNVSYLGAATGDAVRADAARSLREMKHVIAFYSDKLANLPDAPTNIVVSNPTEHGATISWDEVAGATSYVVRVYVSGSYSYSTTTSTTYTVNDSTWFPLSCTDYKFFIVAVSECGDAGSAIYYTFTTKCATDPTVITEAATNITPNSATLNKTVTANGAVITEQGFKYRKPSESSWQTIITDNSSYNLTGLTANAQYEFHAYATTASVTFDGNVLSFPWLIHNVTDAGSQWHLYAAPLETVDLTRFTFNGNPPVDMRELASSATDATWSTLEASTQPNFPAGSAFAYKIAYGYSVPNNGNITFTNAFVADVNFVTKEVEAGKRYTLVGNPIIGDLPFSAFASTNSNVIKNAYQTMSTDGEVFTPSSDDVPAWRGFIVESVENNPGGTLKFTNSAKKPVKSLAAASEKITITAYMGGSTFIKKSAEGQDVVGNNDISFLSMGANYYQQLYTVKPDNSGADRALAINTINTYEAEIPVGVLTTYSGTTFLYFYGMDTWNAYVVLTDKLLNKKIDLTGKDYDYYQFHSTGSVADRFVITISKTMGVEDIATANAKVQAYVKDRIIHVVSPADNPVKSVKVYTINGAVVNAKQALPTGVYVVKVTTQKGTETVKVIVK